jgi:hypothetical protein
MKNSELAPAGVGPVKWLARSIILALVIGVCTAFETTANATIILGNLPASNEQPGADVGFGTQEAVKFTMGSSGAVLSNVILRVKTNPPQWVTRHLSLSGATATATMGAHGHKWCWGY